MSQPKNNCWWLLLLHSRLSNWAGHLGSNLSSGSTFTDCSTVPRANIIVPGATRRSAGRVVCRSITSGTRVSTRTGVTCAVEASTARCTSTRIWRSTRAVSSRVIYATPSSRLCTVSRNTTRSMWKCKERGLSNSRQTRKECCESAQKWLTRSNRQKSETKEW